MNGDYGSWGQLREAVSDEHPLGVSVWAPDTRRSRVRTVEIEKVGYTQTARKRFKSWCAEDVRRMVIDYIVCRFDLKGDDIDYAYALPMNVEWTDKHWTDAGWLGSK